MDEIKAPSVSEVTQILLKNAASRLNPEMVSREALELTMPFAKEVRSIFVYSCGVGSVAPPICIGPHEVLFV